MQRIVHHRRLVRPSILALIALLMQGCSTYRPLDQGSRVPWAKARQIASVDSIRVVPAQASEIAVPAGRVHRVERGDRLSALASEYDVSVEALARANRLRPPYVIYVGQRLRIPERGAATRRAIASTSFDGSYRVRRGDTLSGLARRFDVTMTELAGLNRLAPPYELSVGQMLRVPKAALAHPAAPLTRTASKAEPEVPKAGPSDPPGLSGEGFLWPVNGKVIGGFGPTKDGLNRVGIDIAARKGTPVLAAEDGVVAYADDGIRGYGKMILVRHDEGYITTYAHNSVLLVGLGEVVRRGQVIARVGDTGDVERSQLHFEVRKGTKPIDPETVLVHESTAVASTQ